MSRSFVSWALALVVLAAGILLTVPGLRPGARSRGVPRPESTTAEARQPAWKSRWETLKAQVVARLDELEQREDELSDQEVAVQKAEVALTLTKHDLDVARRALREYEEGTARQERDQMDGEAALAEAEYRAVAEPFERRVRPAEGDPPPAPGPADEQVLRRARLMLEQVKAKQDTLVRLTQPRRTAELTRDVQRTKDEAALKQAALDQERVDAKKLRKLLEDDALVPDERRSLAVLAEISRLTASPDAARDPLARQIGTRLDEASTLWTGAERARTTRKDEALRSRLERAAKTGSGRTPEE